MLSPLFKNVNWNHITSVGFDMDGTLYDEFDFIKQVYSEINKQLILNDSILSFMTERWLEKGSSYPLIFSEAYDKCESIFVEKEDFIFFSNYESPKAEEFSNHNQISALIYWNTINTQIRMKAFIKKTTKIFKKLEQE